MVASGSDQEDKGLQLPGCHCARVSWAGIHSVCSLPFSQHHLPPLWRRPCPGSEPLPCARPSRGWISAVGQGSLGTAWALAGASGACLSSAGWGQQPTHPRRRGGHWAQRGAGAGLGHTARQGCPCSGLCPSSSTCTKGGSGLSFLTERQPVKGARACKGV